MIKPVYLVWDDASKRYVHNTTRDFGIYSSKAEEFFSREDLDEAYEQGVFDEYNGYTTFNSHGAIEQLIEHDGKPYKESE